MEGVHDHLGIRFARMALLLTMRRLHNGVALHRLRSERIFLTSRNVPRAEQMRERPPAEMRSSGQLPRAEKLSLEEWQPWKALLFSPSLTAFAIDANDACSCSQAADWSISQPTAAYVIECLSACITGNSSLAALAGHQYICSRRCTRTDFC